MIQDYKLDNVQFLYGDCLERMKEIPDRSIDCIITDPPYGTVACAWDSVISFEPMWAELKRIIKQDGAIVLFGSQPFTSKLICSNLDMFKYCMVWEKSRAGNFIHSKFQPLKAHEDIIVFSMYASTYTKNNKNMKYNPIKSKGKPYDKGENKNKQFGWLAGGNREFTLKNETGDRFPRSVVYFKTADSEGKPLHQTQKPIALMEYLIKTYSNEGDTILDFTFGSCTTGIACLNTNRNFIGIEKDEHYYKIGTDRLFQALKEKV